MTLKIKDLEMFLKQFKNRGLEQISDNQMDYAIGREFGISIHIRKSIKQSLVEFGFIEEVTPGIWKIKWKDFKPNEKKGLDEDVSKFDEIIGGN